MAACGRGIINLMPKLVSSVSNAAVIRAVYHHSHRWATTDELADHLRAEPDAVAKVLRDLQRSRLLACRQRDNRRVWMPWDTV